MLQLTPKYFLPLLFPSPELNELQEESTKCKCLQSVQLHSNLKLPLKFTQFRALLSSRWSFPFHPKINTCFYSDLSNSLGHSPRDSCLASVSAEG